MARRALEIFQAAFPDTSDWTMREQARFIDQARKRFEAILAVTGQGEEVDEALVGDLQDVGAGAAWAGSPLPQLLVVLRISRDLVVQTAVEIAEERGKYWGLALSLLLTRVLPAMDRLTDALAQGYWAAIVGREEENRARYENLVEHSSDGVYEVDLDGRISYANPSFAAIVGRPLAEIDGRPLPEVFNLAEDAPIVERLTHEHHLDFDELSFEIVRPDGVHRELDVVTFPRRHEGTVEGFQGIVHDATAARDLDRAKNEFLALITHDLRNPLTTVLGLAVTLEAYAGELPEDRVRRMGASIRRQAERMSRLADDLYDMSRIESSTLALHLREVAVAPAIDAALASVEDPAAVEIDAAPAIAVMADSRRLEQIVANLVENALVHGAPPVTVAAFEQNGSVEIVVRDHGNGVPDAVVPTLFSRLQTVARHDRDRKAGTGLGLFLVRGLVEAMGGRIWYEAPSAGEGPAFRFRLPTPRRRDAAR
jgi:PAS domain S-box-containing protein